MKTPAFFIAALLMAAGSASALSVENYRKVKLQSESADEMDAKIARLILTGYFQGVEEVIFGQRSGTNSPIKVTGDLQACVPQTVVVNSDLLRAALDQEIGVHGKVYADIPDWEQSYAANYALLGLARMFPCRSNMR